MSQELEESLEMLESTEVSERKKAVFRLGETKDERAVPNLIKALSDEDDVVRANSARALGKIGHPDAVLPLINALEDENTRVIQNAAWALGNLEDDRALKPLLKLVDPKYTVYTLHGDAGGGSRIANGQQQQEGVRNSDVIVQAINSLEKLNNANAVPTLIDALSMEGIGPVRCAAAKALGTINDKDAVPPLIVALNDPQWYVRRDATYALGLLKDGRAVQPLLQKLTDMYEQVKKNALDALIKIGTPANEALFKLYLKDSKNEQLKAYISTISQKQMIKIVKSLISKETNEKKKEFLKSFLAKIQK